jgi:hypothetical protein
MMADAEWRIVKFEISRNQFTPEALVGQLEMQKCDDATAVYSEPVDVAIGLIVAFINQESLQIAFERQVLKLAASKSADHILPLQLPEVGPHRQFSVTFDQLYGLSDFFADELKAASEADDFEYAGLLRDFRNAIDCDDQLEMVRLGQLLRLQVGLELGVPITPVPPDPPP